MGYAQTFQPSRHYYLRCVAIIAAICLVWAACHAQDTKAEGQTKAPSIQDLGKYPNLLEEIGQVFEKLQNNVQFPAARTESRLLPRLPPSTVFYAAFPNYGSAANQALEIFRQALQESPALRQWWQRGEMAAMGPKFEGYLEKFSQLHEYLGEEIVVSAEVQAQRPRLLVIAEVRKPGLKRLLEQMVEELASTSKLGVRVLGAEEFAAATVGGASDEFLVLVRPDFAVAAQDLATLRSASARLDANSRDFASTPFGQRVLQEFQGGLTISVAMDLHEILNYLPPAARQNPTFQSTGFADLKYFVWGQKNVAGKTVSEAELSFTAPRHGVASWLATSGPLGSLEFVSPRAVAAAAIVLKSPAQIFEEVEKLATVSNANAFAALTQFEQALKLRLKDDLLAHLGGELTLEVSNLGPPQPAWKAILAVKDSVRLQQTLNTLLAALPFEVMRAEDGGVTYHTVRIPSAKAPIEVGYSLVDDYLLIGSSRDVVAEAVRLHRSGESLAKSNRFLASLPPGHSQGASALLYMDPIAMTALRMRRLAPEMVESVIQSSEEIPPAVVGLYAEEAAIRQSTTSPTFNVGAVMVVGAIAIPNLLRARIAANEASAVGSVRSVNTAQYTYSAMHPQRGFAPNLATLGPGASGAAAESADHADLLDGLLADPSCTGEAWCTKSGYRFRVAGVCKQRRCDDYMVVAAPVTPNTTGTRGFCSTSDGVIRIKLDTPAALPLTVTECKAWPPL